MPKKHYDDAEHDFTKMLMELNDVANGKASPPMGEDPIGDALDTPPVRFERTFVVPASDNGVERNASVDYSEVRDNIRQLIADGKSGIDGLLKVAIESESPRAYEVLATYLKTVGDLNQDLMILHEQRAKIDTEQAKAKNGGGTPITNNNVFVGSTEDLQRYLEGRNS